MMLKRGCSIHRLPAGGNLRLQFLALQAWLVLFWPLLIQGHLIYLAQGPINTQAVQELRGTSFSLPAEQQHRPAFPSLMRSRASEALAADSTSSLVEPGTDFGPARPVHVATGVALDSHYLVEGGRNDLSLPQTARNSSLQQAAGLSGNASEKPGRPGRESAKEDGSRVKLAKGTPSRKKLSAACRAFPHGKCGRRLGSLSPDSPSQTSGFQEQGAAQPLWTLALTKQILLKLDSEAAAHPEMYGRLARVAESTQSRILGYMPRHAFLVFVPSLEAVNELRRLPGVTWAGEYDSQAKLAPEWQPILRTLQHPGAPVGGHRVWKHEGRDSHGRLLVNVVLALGGHVNDRILGKPLRISHDLARRWEQGLNKAIAVDNQGKVETSTQGTLNLESPRLSFNEVQPGKATTEVRGSAGIARERDGPATATPGTGARVMMRAVGAELVQAAVPPEDVPFALEWLSRQEWVHWLAPQPITRLHNMWASAVIQSGRFRGVGAPSGSARAFWAAGITGHNQTLGVGDSGVDMKSCFFQDPTTATAGPSHRKVAGYRIANGGNAHDDQGHGTHVCGSMLGQCLPSAPNATESANSNGMAPSSKLFFTDMGTGQVDYVIPPGDMGRDYYAYAFEAGAHIHSDSWSTGSPTYDFLARSVDDYTFHNPRFLPFVAAGNMGAAHDKQATVGSPAVAKNCLTVGATLLPLDSPSPRGTAFNLSVVAPRPASLLVDRTWYKLLAHSYGASFSAHPAKWAEPHRVVRGEPGDGCSALQDAPTLRGAIVLLDRGNCLYATKLRNAQAAGAASILVGNSSPLGYFLMAPPFGSDPSVTIPGGSIPLAVARTFHAALANGSQLLVSIQPLEAEPSYGADSMAGFSSWGPTLDGRVKPELTAPGNGIRSAKSSPAVDRESCQTTEMSGTSMAAPIAAGAAALIREYFMEGFHPSGQKSPGDGFEPTGVLVKAVLLNGATHMTGLNGDGHPMDLPPSMNQGFGRLDLLNSVHLANHNSLRLVVKEGPPLKTGYGQRYCLLSRPDGANDLKITIAWHDAPGTLGADPQQAVLVNDLDLRLRAPDGHRFWGNGGAHPDAVNNVEQIWITRPQSGRYVVEVRGQQVNVPGADLQGQTFALAARGPISEVPCLEIYAVPPPAPLTNQASLRLPLFGTAGPTIKWLCRLFAANETRTTSWQACSSQFTSRRLPDDTYLFQAVVQDFRYANVLTSAIYNASFSIETVPPTTTLTSHSTAPFTAFASFTFSSSAPDLSRFQCLLMGSSIQAPGQVRAASLSTPATPGQNPNAGGELGPASLHGTASALQAPSSPPVPGEGTLLRRNLVHRWRECSSPAVYSGLYDGNYTFQVRAVDAAGNSDPQPPSWSWLLTTLLPAAAITASPGPYTNSTFPQFRFALDLPGVPGVTGQPVWECCLQAAAETHAAITLAWQPCSSPFAPSWPLAEGRYTFSVRAVSSWGLHNLSNASASVGFTVDTTPPKTAVLSQPPPISTLNQVKIIFISSEEVHYLCQVIPESGANDLSTHERESCSSPFTVYGSLPDGRYQFRLQAVDLAGNHGALQLLHFLLDTALPSIVSLSGVAGSENFTADFGGTDDVTGSGVVGYLCRLVRSGPGTELAQAWAPCSPPVAHTGLGWGDYVFQVRAVDGAGHVSSAPAATNFSLPAPTGVQPGPIVQLSAPLPAHFTNKSVAEFWFSSASSQNGPGAETFRCSVGSNASAESCSSPVRVGPLGDGNYTWRVRAMRGDDTGPWQSFHWSIDTQPPSTVITSPPSFLLSTISPVFHLSGYDPPQESGVDRIECKLTGQPPTNKSHDWRVCTAITSYQELPDGLYTFVARAIDLAGNTDPIAATSTFIVNIWLTVLQSVATGEDDILSPVISSTTICPESGPCHVHLGSTVAVVSKSYMLIVLKRPDSPAATRQQEVSIHQKAPVQKINCRAEGNSGQGEEEMYTPVSEILILEASATYLLGPVLLTLRYNAMEAITTRSVKKGFQQFSNETSLLAFSLVETLFSAMEGSDAVSSQLSPTEGTLSLLFSEEAVPSAHTKWRKLESQNVWFYKEQASALIESRGSYVVATRNLDQEPHQPESPRTQQPKGQNRLGIDGIIGIAVSSVAASALFIAVAVYCFCQSRPQRQVAPDISLKPPYQSTAPKQGECPRKQRRPPGIANLLLLGRKHMPVSTQTPPETPTRISTTAMLPMQCRDRHEMS